MDPKYDPSKVESRIYDMWEKGHYFTPKINKSQKPFAIILPLPNANDPMHMGHALFTIQDILIRYHRLQGSPTLWLPGSDHAGIETQYVFEKHLAKEGKSRFDFDRETLFKMIWDFVEKNREINIHQMKRLGFSLDWTRYHYSLEPEIVKRVLATFKKLHDDGLIYRSDRIVNYCTHCGTAFSDLEVDHQEKEAVLYYLDYGPITIATTRPETIFADVAVAVNPQDKRYQELIGQTATVPLIDKGVPIIADSDIDIKFGTGALKVTPGHDILDFEIGKRHDLPTLSVISLDGRLINTPDKYLGLKVKEAREKVVTHLKAAGKLKKEEPLRHAVGICYRCGTVIEPLIMPQWYLRTQHLAHPAIKAVKEGKIKIVPKKRFEKMYFSWLQNIEDWNISRQIVWGPRLPVWYEYTGAANIWVYWLNQEGKLQQGNVRQFIDQGISLEEIKRGLQRTWAMTGPSGPNYVISETEPQDGKLYLPETDTFDTWFLSSQWPVNTLKSKPGDFEYFYPTSVLDTLWDILFFWVARMVMMGIYLTSDVPFRAVHLHSRVVDAKGQKMSKSKGNVINPIDMVDKYGADALRLALVIGVAPASDIVISDDKVRAMRNFANKLWNIARFLCSTKETKNISVPTKQDKALQSLVTTTTKQTTNDLNKYNFGQASDRLYHVVWHEFADVYLEDYKKGLVSYSVLLDSFQKLLVLLHPFMPYVTEEIWGLLGNKTALIISPWPEV